MTIQLTDRAIKAIKKQTKPFLRIGVRGSGCKGFSIVFRFEEEQKDTDNLFEFDGYKVIIDSKSLKILDGATVDYHRSLMKAGFKIDIPNAKYCGCGSSFNKE